MRALVLALVLAFAGVHLGHHHHPTYQIDPFERHATLLP